MTNSEPTLKLTKIEREFCESVETGRIMRDADGQIIFLRTVINQAGEKVFTGAVLCEDFFPFIIDRLGEVWTIEDLLKLEVEE